MAPKPKAKPAGVVGGSRRKRRQHVVEGGPEGRVPGSRVVGAPENGGMFVPNGPPPPTPVNLPAEMGGPGGRVPGSRAVGAPENGGMFVHVPMGPPPPTPVNLPAEGGVPGPAAGGLPALNGPPPPRPVNLPSEGTVPGPAAGRLPAPEGWEDETSSPPFPEPPMPSEEEFKVARAVKEDLELDDATVLMVHLEPNAEAVRANRIVVVTVEGMTPEELERRGLARNHVAMCFDVEMPPPLASMVGTPPLETGCPCHHQNTNSNTAGAEGRVPAGGEGGGEGRVPAGGEGGGEGRVPAGGELAGYRDGPDIDMGVFASDNEDGPPVGEVSIRGGVGFRRSDPRSGFLGVSDSDSDAILEVAIEGFEVSSNDAAEDVLPMDAAQ